MDFCCSYRWIANENNGAYKVILAFVLTIVAFKLLLIGAAYAAIIYFIERVG